MKNSQIRRIWYLIIALLRSFANVKFKKIIEDESDFQFEILTIYDFIDIAVTSIVCLFTSNFNCNIGEVQDYLCKVSENNNTERFINSFPIYSKTFGRYSLENKTQNTLEILVIIFGSLTFIINKFCSLKVIRYLNPVLFVFYFPLLFLLRKIVIIINTLFISKGNFKADIVGINKVKSFLDMIGDIISLISFLLFSELILLNFGKYIITGRRPGYIRTPKISLIYGGYFNREKDDIYI